MRLLLKIGNVFAKIANFCLLLAYATSYFVKCPSKPLPAVDSRFFKVFFSHSFVPYKQLITHMKTPSRFLITMSFSLITLLIIVADTNCFGQDSIQRYPKLSRKGRSYIYGSNRISEEEMQAQLMLLGNDEITKEIRLAQEYKKLQMIGYYAIPLGIFATYLSISAQPILWEPYEPKKEKMSYVCYGATFLAISSSVYFKINRNKKNAKALQLYKKYYGNK